MIDLAPAIVSIKLAFITTIILLIIGVPFAWWLARTRHWSKVIFESVVALPLVLPPTVIGFYLLILFGKGSFLGNFDIAFSFTGLVIGSVIYSLPFVVQPLQTSFSSIDERLLEAASTLRASTLDRFMTIVMPLSRRGFLTASILGFAHTLGEFGIVLMIGGNIPGKTQTLSIAIYDNVEQLEYAKAHIMSGGLLAFSFAVLFIVFWSNRSRRRV